MMSLSRFIIYFTLYSLLVFSIAFGFSVLWNERLILSPNFILVFVFLYSLTIIIYFLGLWGVKKGAEYSIFSLLGGVVIKMIISLSLVLYLFMNYPENQKVLALNFFSLYLLFTLFEVTVMLRNLRHQNKK